MENRVTNKWDQKISDKREIANAAYHLRVQRQADLVNFANSREADPEGVEWHFELYWRAVQRERFTEAEAKAESATKQ